MASVEKAALLAFVRDGQATAEKDTQAAARQHGRIGVAPRSARELNMVRVAANNARIHLLEQLRERFDLQGLQEVAR